MSAPEVLRRFLTSRSTFTPEELADVDRSFSARTLKAGDFFQRAGEPARFAIFVASGCLRAYVIDNRGVEKILQFAPEEWWLADIASLLSGQPATFFIDAIEDSELMIIDPPAHHAGSMVRHHLTCAIGARSASGAGATSRVSCRPDPGAGRSFARSSLAGGTRPCENGA